LTKKTKCQRATGQFGKMAALSRPKFSVTLQACGSSERQWKPRLRQAASPLGATETAQQTINRKIER